MIKYLPALASIIKSAATIKNMKSTSTKVAGVATTGALVAHEVLPPDSFEAAVIKTLLGIIAVIGFLKPVK